jgi:hypothetical protein
VDGDGESSHVILAGVPDQDAKEETPIQCDDTETDGGRSEEKMGSSESRLASGLNTVAADNSGSVGLCFDCRHARVIRSDRGSIFYLCRLSATDPRFAKYPRLPVLSCAGYQKQEPAAP